ncbi:MAG: amino acid-binding protein [Candidatus Korarchaeota archaeon]|nr:amino acid-binding protein [Candidatus Korarchaeota archaeon]NIU81924.1 amino acid-binding protein [Candidatus Thorarchaeota archaeon]NIW12382.1 amino acid-binding protein [Candidatus Thorarchaeota archaeon]NIW51174.1 amino acid-binding protein [Candidatus Korarchaeota archaeon]
MWKKISRLLADYPERLAVARTLVEKGLSIKDGTIWYGDILIPIIRVARVTGVDRRTVKKAITMIEKDSELNPIFEAIKPAGPSLEGVAKHLGLGVVEITPTDARIPGILAKAATLIAERDISIRQVIMDDPELSPEPKTAIITEQKIPGSLVPKFLKINGVAKVSIY